MKRNIKKKNLLFIWMAVVSVSSCLASIKDSISIEKFTYYTQDSIPIRSTLYLPKEKVHRVVILLCSEIFEFRHPDFTLNADTADYKMITAMTSVGSGVVLISPRYRPTDGIISKIKKQTYETQADDVDVLCSYLKKDSRFKNLPIGICGFSATGITAAKVASRNTKVDFVILIVTPSITGVEDLNYKWKTDLKVSVKPTILRYFSQFTYFFPLDHFIYKDSVYRGSMLSLGQAFGRCAWDCLQQINSTVVQKYNNVDTIQFYAGKMLKESFQVDKLEKKVELNVLGTKKNYSPDEFIDLLVKDLIYTPFDIDFLKWNPEDYYPKINCPVLMLFAEKDINIDAKGSIANSKRIIETYKKNNFSFFVIPGVDHNFYVPNNTFTVKEESGKSKILKTQSEEFFQTMLFWLNRILD